MEWEWRTGASSSSTIEQFVRGVMKQIPDSTHTSFNLATWENHDTYKFVVQKNGSGSGVMFTGFQIFTVYYNASKDMIFVREYTHSDVEANNGSITSDYGTIAYKRLWCMGNIVYFLLHIQMTAAHAPWSTFATIDDSKFLPKTAEVYLPAAVMRSDGTITTSKLVVINTGGDIVFNGTGGNTNAGDIISVAGTYIMA